MNVFSWDIPLPAGIMDAWMTHKGHNADKQNRILDWHDNNMFMCEDRCYTDTATGYRKNILSLRYAIMNNISYWTWIESHAK